MSAYQQHIYRTAVDMSVTSEILMDMVFLCGINQPMINDIRSAAVIDRVCSFPTAYAKLHWLVDRGYVGLKVDEKDARIKRMHITTKGVRHIAKQKENLLD